MLHGLQHERRSTNVQIKNIDFSQAYEQSIGQRMLAEAEADRIEALARAEAAQIKLRGNAEADAITARGAALANSPRLVELVQAERWNGVLPKTVLPTTAMPIISNPAPK